MHDDAECTRTISSHNYTGITHRRKPAVKPQSRMTTPQRGLHGPFSQNHLSCICVEMVKCDIDARPSRVLRCSASYRIHMYTVYRLFGSMFTNVIGRTTDICCKLMFCCVVCSYTRSIMDEEGSFESIITTFTINIFQV